jgi:hypothetical protein
MRIVMWSLIVAFGVVPGTHAQAPATGPSPSSPVITEADVQTALVRAAADLKGGAAVSDRLINLSDIKSYNVGVAVVARPAGTFTGSLAHDKVTEIYYVLKGSGTQVTGTIVDGTRGERPSPVVGPGESSNTPLRNATSRKLAAGDIQSNHPAGSRPYVHVDRPRWNSISGFSDGSREGAEPAAEVIAM